MLVIISGLYLYNTMYQSSSVACPPYPREIMKWTEDNVYQPVFQALMDADPTHSGSNQVDLIDSLCSCRI